MEVKLEVFGPLISVQIDNTPKEFVATLKKTGFLHVRRGKTCDDFTLAITDPDSGGCVAAVADGVSSSPDSRFGARVAVQSCVVEMADRELKGESLDKDGVSTSFRHAADEAAQLSQLLSGSYNSCATTLLATARTKEYGTESLNIGDGHIAYHVTTDSSFKISIPLQREKDNDQKTLATIHLHLNQAAGQRIYSDTLGSYLLATDGLDQGFGWMDTTKKLPPGCTDLAAGLFARLFEHLQRGRFDILHHFLHQLGSRKGDDMAVVMFAPKFDRHSPRTWATLGIEQNELFSGAYIAGLGPSFACTTVIEDYASNLSISALVRMNQVDGAGLRARVEVNRIFQKVFAAWIRGERDLEQSRALVQELLCHYEQDVAVAQVGIVIAYHQGFTLVGRCGDVAVYTQSGDAMISLPADGSQGKISLSVFDQGIERLVLADSQERALAAGTLVQASLRSEQIPVESLELKKWHGLSALQSLEPSVGDGVILIYSNQWMFRSGLSPLCEVLGVSGSGLGLLLTGRPEVNQAYIDRVYGPLPSKLLVSGEEPAVSGTSSKVAAGVTTDTVVAAPTGTTVAGDNTSVPSPNDGIEQSKANVVALDPDAVRQLVRQNPKVTFSPEWKQEYVVAPEKGLFQRITFFRRLF